MIVRVTPSYDFDGYPDGIRKVSFLKGVEASVPKDYADLLVAKKAAVYATVFPPAKRDTAAVAAAVKGLKAKASPDNE